MQSTGVPEHLYIESPTSLRTIWYMTGSLIETAQPTPERGASGAIATISPNGRRKRINALIPFEITPSSFEIKMSGFLFSIFNLNTILIIQLQS